jgi:glyoxylase-like metal-dependent hydrolase (beta-lactamase superfamily II)
MILETINVGVMQVNCYVLACAAGQSAIIIDPGDQADKINDVLKRHQLKPAMVINTHGHYDHIGSDDEFGVLVCAHKKDLPMLLDPRKNLSASFSLAYKVRSAVRALEDKEAIILDCLELEVIHLPGHTPGGIGLLMKKPQNDIVFTGDTLFCQGVGRWDLPGGSQRDLEEAIRQRLFTLPLSTKVYPGHGSSTTIGREKSGSTFSL